MNDMRTLYTITIILALSAAGCDLMLGLGDKEDPVPFRDGDTTDGLWDLDMDTDVDIEIPPNCGNGAVDDGEQCDDGNDVDGDGCNRDCTWSCHEFTNCADLEPCNGHEVCNLATHTCDPGTPLEDGALCLDDPRSICLDGVCGVSVCGDGYVDTAAGEFCDPPGGDCSDTCRIMCASDENCPDDREDCNGEEFCDLETHVCDRRNPLADGTHCGDDGYLCLDQVCVPSRCGDGFVDTSRSEQCDDGNTTSGDGCSPSCRFEPLPPPSCGNAVVDSSLETCDDGNNANGDACNPTCNFTNTTTLFLGSPGLGGFTSGTGTGARISGVGGFALCGNTLYLADTSANLVRRIDIPTASISTLAGDAVNGLAGYADSTSGLEARFDSPSSVATDGATLWVGDANNRRIRAIDLMSPGMPVTTVAGSGIQGHVDGVGTAARFDYIHGLTYYDGYVYLLETNAATLRRFDPATAAVITLAGTPYETGGTDGVGSIARFVSPRNMISDYNGLLYISDTNGAKIRVFDIATSEVSTFVGNGTSGYVDGVGDAVRINRPRGLTFDGTSLYWVEFNSQTVRQGIVSSVSVSTMVGTQDTSGYSEGIGTAALLDGPFEIAFHYPTNSLFVLDANNYVIRRIQ